MHFPRGVLENDNAYQVENIWKCAVLVDLIIFLREGFVKKKREICGILIYSFKGVYLFSFISFIFLSFRGVFNKMILPLALDGY